MTMLHTVTTDRVLLKVVFLKNGKKKRGHINLITGRSNQVFSPNFCETEAKQTKGMDYKITNLKWFCTLKQGANQWDKFKKFRIQLYMSGMYLFSTISPNLLCVP